MRFIDAIKLLNENNKMYRESNSSFYYLKGDEEIYEVLETPDCDGNYKGEISLCTTFYDIDKNDWVVE